MKKGRKNYSANFKAKVALEALKEQQTLSELSSRYEVHGNMISSWKRTLQEEASLVFDKKRGVKSKEDEALQERLYQQIGQLQVELDWLKKKLNQ